MQNIDFMLVLKQYMDKNRYQRQLYPTLPIPEHAIAIEKRLITSAAGLATAFIDKDIVGIAEGIADSMYDLFGLCHSCGIPIEGVFEEIHRAKMYKKKANVAAVLKPHIEAKLRAHNDRTDKVSEE